MAKRVLVDPRSDRIVQIEDVEFEVAPPLEWRTGPDEIREDWRIVGGAFQPPLPPLPERDRGRADLLTSLRNNSASVAIVAYLATQAGVTVQQMFDDIEDAYNTLKGDIRGGVN